ncbi:MAG: glycosyltransferase family 2 protein [Gammaproteobacteria bacterium]
MQRDGLTAVIPACNEAGTLRAVVCGVLAHIGRVIVVDDGSTDGTAAVLDGLCVTVLQNPGHLGKAASLWRGFTAAPGAPALITLDADGQHDPRDLPRLIEAYRADREAIIVGARLHHKRRVPRGRYYANRLANFWISWAAGQAIPDTQCGYRIYPQSVLTRLRDRLDRTQGFVFESEVLIEAARRGIRVVSVPVTAVYPRGRRSHFKPIADIAAITRMVAWKLLARGLYPQGLWCYLRELFDARARRGAGARREDPGRVLPTEI